MLPPWTLRGDAYWFFPLPSLLPWSSSRLPQAAHDPIQATKAGQNGGAIGGLGNVQLVRYTESPVGSYDELIYIPGHFEVPSDPAIGRSQASRSAIRITRIYVSTIASVVNGRRNWNIPKRLARFTFEPADPSRPSGPTRVSVFASISTADHCSPSFATEPFFSVILTPSNLPVFPFRSSYIPLDLRLVMPPLVDGTADGDELVGTERWASLTPAMTSDRCQAIWGKGAMVGPGDKWADGVGFPDIKPIALGFVWKDVSS